MYGPGQVPGETVNLFSRIPMFPVTKSRETSGLEGKENYLMLCYIFRLFLNHHIAKTNKDGARTTTAQLYPGLDTFEFELKLQPVEAASYRYQQHVYRISKKSSRVTCTLSIPSLSLLGMIVFSQKKFRKS